VTGNDDFARRLLERVLKDAYNREPGTEKGALQAAPRRTRAADAALGLAARAGFTRRGFGATGAARRLARSLHRAEEFGALESLLADQASRDLLMTLLSFRALGPRHVALPVSQRAFRTACKRIDRRMRVRKAVARDTYGHLLHQYEIPASNATVSYVGIAHVIQEIFVEPQYAFERDGQAIGAAPGDIVVDGGGGWGETALYFADEVGPAGRVHCFEFAPENLALIEGNLDLNPGLRERIDVVPHPLWDRAGETHQFAGVGGASSIARAADSHRGEIDTQSVDELCNGERVDFIKLDVEGAEMRALAGAEETIRRHRPKLAISVYHEEDDLFEIPMWVAGLDLGYRLYLDHRWPGVAETILFARA
jgi:FkbM family methyltransferase